MEELVRFLRDAPGRARRRGRPPHLRGHPGVRADRPTRRSPPTCASTSPLHHEALVRSVEPAARSSRDELSFIRPTVDRRVGQDPAVVVHARLPHLPRGRCGRPCSRPPSTSAARTPRCTPSGSSCATSTSAATEAAEVFLEGERLQSAAGRAAAARPHGGPARRGRAGARARSSPPRATPGSPTARRSCSSPPR